MSQQLALFSSRFTAEDADESGLLPDHPDYQGMIIYSDTPAEERFFQEMWAEFGSGQCTQWRCLWPRQEKTCADFRRRNDHKTMIFYHVGFHSTRIRKVEVLRETKYFIWFEDPLSLTGEHREAKRHKYRSYFKTRDEAIKQLIEWNQ